MSYSGVLQKIILQDGGHLARIKNFVLSVYNDHDLTNAEHT